MDDAVNTPSLPNSPPSDHPTRAKGPSEPSGVPDHSACSLRLPAHSGSDHPCHFLCYGVSASAPVFAAHDRAAALSAPLLPHLTELPIVTHRGSAGQHAELQTILESSDVSVKNNIDETYIPGCDTTVGRTGPAVPDTAAEQLAIALPIPTAHAQVMSPAI